MNSNFNNQQFHARTIASNLQSQNLNKLLQQTAAKNVTARQNIPELSRQNNNGVNSEIGTQQSMHFMLQKQKSNMSQNSFTAMSQSVNRSAPPRYSPPIHKSPPARQYLLVQRPQIQITQNNPVRHPPSNVSSTPHTTVALGAKLQLGQTYQFDVKRSPSYPNSIILKRAPTISQAQRIPMSADDKGKFIPFSNLMMPGRTTERIESSKNLQNSNKLQRIPSILSSQPKQQSVFFSLSPNYNSSSSVEVDTTQNHVIPKQQNSFPSSAQSFPLSANKPVAPKPVIKAQLNGGNHDIMNSTSTDNIEPFDWDEYLKVTNTKSVPHAAFKHVEISLHNGFSPGMKLEVANKSDPTTYWVATLISTCGQLLLLRYDGYGEDRKTDFWADVRTADLHPIGWCAQNGKILQPPEPIRNMHENWAEFLVRNLIGARTAPEHLLSGPFKGKTVVEMIEPRMLLEVQDSHNLQHVWMADVIKNIGGRLLLRYKGLSEDDSKFDFWLFYLDVRLHQVGWGKEHQRTMKPPNQIRHKYGSNEEWAYVLQMSLKGLTEHNLVPQCVFNDQVKIKQHDLRETWKVAVLDPTNPTRVRPATVVKIVDPYYYLVELDDVRHQGNSCAFLCHSGSPVFSIEWCKTHQIPITPPKGYNVHDFRWDSYLNRSLSTAAPESSFAALQEKHEFQTGMQLEACNPYNPDEICVASVVAVYGHVLRLQLSTVVKGATPQSGQTIRHIQCLVLSSSHDIFPVGWCDSNIYPLSAPQAWQQKPFISAALSASFPNKKVAVVQPEVQVKPLENKMMDSVHSVINPSSDSKLWCPVICFNSSCNSGIFINSHALSKVPKFVGPGNTVLVIKEVLSLLVGAAERPHKMLKDLEDFTANQGDEPCVIKAKYEGKKYQATLHIVNTATKVPQFFIAVTKFLKCCPNLLTVENGVVECPLNCIKEKNPTAKGLTSHRGRKKKAIERTKGCPVVSSVPKPLMRSSLKSLKGKPSSYGSKYGLRYIQLSSKIRGNMHGQKERSSLRLKVKNSLKNSMQLALKKERLNIEQKLKRRRQKTKLIKLDVLTNPLHWSVEDVAAFMETTECPDFADVFREQHIDGQALLLLTLPFIQECMELKLGPALKLARQVERVKIAFYEGYGNE